MPTYIVVEVASGTIIARLCDSCPRYHFYTEVKESVADSVARALNRDE